MRADVRPGIQPVRRLVLCMAAVFALSAWTPAHAEEPSLVEQIGQKLGRGVANLLTGWVEIPKQVYVVGQKEGWLAGALRGPFDGIGMFGARTIAGAYEILTFPVPVPSGYRPLFEPGFVWEPDPHGPPAGEKSTDARKP